MRSSPKRSRPLGQGMQDIDGPDDIEALPQPARRGRPRIKVKPLRLVLGLERPDRVGGHRVGWRDVREEPPIRPQEPKVAVGLTRDLVSLLMHRAVVTATKQREVRERRETSLGPVADVVPLREAAPAAREAATAIPMVER